MTANESTIKLNNKFYSKESIEEAISAFKHICSVRIEDDRFNLFIESKEDEDIERIKKEFANYCLGMMR